MFKKLVDFLWNNDAARKAVKRLVMTLLEGAAKSSKTKVDDQVVDAVKELLDEED